MERISEESVQRRADVGEKILRALTQNGLNDLMMLIYETFGAPILLGDINSRVIFQYPLAEIGDVVYDTMLREKTIDPEMAERYIQECEHNKYDLWAPMYVDRGLVAKCPRLYGVVSYYGIKQATLAIFLGEKPLREGDFELVKMFTDALEVKFKKDINGNLDWVPPTAVCLQDILEPAASPYLKRAAERTLSENLLGEFAIMVTPIGGTERQRNYAFHAVKDMMRHYRNLVSVIFDQELITLFGEVKQEDFHPHEQRFIRELTDQLYRYQLVTGVSGAFSDLSMTIGYYQQAKLVAQIASEKGDVPVLCSQDVSERLPFRIVANSPRPEIFLHPLLQKLQEYDRKNNSVYFPTLRAYCLSFFDREKGASQCCSHRNTLVYRLNRLMELFGVDLEDADLRRELYCSFLLWDEIESSFPKRGG